MVNGRTSIQAEKVPSNLQEYFEAHVFPFVASLEWDEEEVAYIETPISEFTKTVDLLYPLLTNDGHYVVWFVGAFLWMVPG